MAIRTQQSLTGFIATDPQLTYTEKGEAPGVWMGRGLAAVPDFPVGDRVTEAQMVALFGEGRHPNADQIERAAQLAFEPPLPLLMTEKDAVKCRAFAAADWWYLAVDAVPTPAFVDWLDKELARLIPGSR